MFQLLTLSLAGVLFAFPGLPNWSGWRNLRHRPPAAVDSLPPAWKPSSRLVLEDRFVQAGLPALGSTALARLNLTQDPRRLRVAFDPDSARVSYAVEFGNVSLGQPVSIPLSTLPQELSDYNFRKIWAKTSHDKINQMAGRAAQPAAASGLSFKFPSPLPKRVQSLLGPGGPALNVSGSQQIRLSGTSNWTNLQVGTLGQRRSLFPSLDMQQDLNIQLEGQLSDRVRVNLLQNSAVQIPLQNRIAINYKGEEDDLIQELALGHTNLTLPGTQFVSYSGRNEGLFGAKVSSRLGPFDFTVLASKQEGRSERASYAGGSSKQTQEIADLDYVKGVYYFLYDPNKELQYPDQASFQLLLDEGVYANTVGLVRGNAYLDPRIKNTSPGDTLTSPFVRGNFKPLRQGADLDYEVMRDNYGPQFLIIRLRRPLTSENQVLAVSYQYRDTGPDGNPTGPVKFAGGDSLQEVDGQYSYNLKLLRAPQLLLTVDINGNYVANDPFNATRDLELKNFYQLAGQRIDPKTFEMYVRRGDDQPPVVQRVVNGRPVPYTEMLGLDNYDETSGFVSYDQYGHDGRVDGSGVASNVRPFIDFENGTMFFPELRPFAPRLGAAGGLFDHALSRRLFRSDSLVGAADSANGANLAVYDRRTVLRQDRRYTLELTFNAARAGGEIPLGRTNIIEGSEVVTVNGQALVRDRDYRVDYDLGKITLIKQLGPSDQVSIDYGYAPLFQQAGRTLLGSAFKYEGLDKRFGGAFMYESRGAQEQRPRIGEEPSRALVGDLFTEWRTRPEFLTRLVDRLPGVRTTAPSQFDISAEVGASFPNPNTANVVYIDDMEGVRDAVTLSTSPDRWHHSSIPLGANGLPVDDIAQPNPLINAETHWYSPVNAIKERDLKPNLENGQGAQNAHQSLAISLPRRPTAATPSDTLWSGLTYVLDPVGLDLSRSQFIELEINDFRDYYPTVSGIGRVRGRHVKLHIDLGVVSEDQQVAPNVKPDGRLNTEDQVPLDNQLSVTDQKNEDTGLDGKLDKDEIDNPPVPTPDLVTVRPGDPAGDDFARPDDTFKDYDPRKWLFTNGYEVDHTIVPVPETEDLNLNTALDTQNRYFEYTLDLGAEGAASPYLIDSVYAPGRRYVNDGSLIPEDNGWRHYRIPINDQFRRRFGTPDLALARHVRVWLEGVYDTDPNPITADDGRPFLAIGELSVVGSRWFAAPLDSDQVTAKTDQVLSSVNTLDNADIYVSPFDPGRTVSGNQGISRREQSISLTFLNLRPSDSLEVYRTFSLDEDYSRYGALDWYATGFRVKGYDPAVDSLAYYVRFASDEIGNNYYEYRAPLPLKSNGDIDWREVRLPLTDLSNLKLDPTFPTTAQVYYRVPGKLPGTAYIIKGRPSFTRLRRISFGLINATSRTLAAGTLWLDELRAVDIYRNPDHAQRVTLSGRMADVLQYSLNYNGRGPDFQSVGDSRGGGNSTSQINLGASMEVHRFFEGTGFVLPVSYAYSGSNSTPRYTAGDDVIRTGAVAAASQSVSASRTWNGSISRSWSARSSKLLLYTLGGMAASASRTLDTYASPTNADTTRSFSASVTYGIAPRALLALPLPFTKSQLYLLPERFYWNYSLGTSENRSYSRLLSSGGGLVPASFSKGRTAFVDFGASFRPIDIFHQEFSARRNLTLAEPLREHIGFVNLGRVTQWRQLMSTRFAFQRSPLFLRPSMTWNANYQQNNGPELSPDMSVRQISNGQGIALGWSFPFDRLFAVPASRPAPGDTLHRARRPGPFRHVLSWIGPLNTDTHFTTTSSYTRLTGTPSFAYLVGVTQNPGLAADSVGGRVQPAFGNRADENTDWGTTLNTRLLLPSGASVTTSADIGSRNGRSNRYESRSDRFNFPQLDFDYGRLPVVLRITRLLSNARLRTAYGRSQSTEYLNSSSPTSISTSSEWRPLIGIVGDYKSGVRTELRIERRITKREDHLFVRTLNTDRITDVNFSISRSYSAGQKVQFLGKTSTVRTSVNLGLTASYSKRSGDTKQDRVAGAASVTNADRLSLNASGAYGFSSNITGNVELGFLQDRNLQTAIVNRSVRVELRGQFTF